MTRRCFHYCSIGLALLWGAWGGSVVRGQSKPSFEAGAAMRIITPDPLLPISGGMGIPSSAKSKQGELTARALVFRSGSETVAVVERRSARLPVRTRRSRPRSGAAPRARKHSHRCDTHPQRTGLLCLS